LNNLKYNQIKNYETEGALFNDPVNQVLSFDSIVEIHLSLVNCFLFLSFYHFFLSLMPSFPPHATLPSSDKSDTNSMAPPFPHTVAFTWPASRHNWSMPPRSASLSTEARVGSLGTGGRAHVVVVLLNQSSPWDMH
jgi:hypothetical protein